MKPHQQNLIREQLEATLSRFNQLKSTAPPQKGWIRAIRDALGMNTRQFSERLGVNRSRIARIEKDEVGGNVTMKTMERVADALDCVFVYGFVPRTSLKETIRKQAEHAVQKQMIRVAHTMALEDQGLSDKERRKALKAVVDELMRTMPKSLWEGGK